MKVVLSIAGSDSSGGAGIQADLKTFEAFGVFGTTAITVLTAQNTTGVHDIYTVEPKFIQKQLQVIKEDFDIASIKIGMLFSNDIIEVVKGFIKDFDIPIVFDPVFISKAGSKLLSDDAIENMKTLLPFCTIATPNLFEAKEMFGYKKDDTKSIKTIQTQPCKVVVKNHIQTINNHQRSVDILYTDTEIESFDTPYIDTSNTHGTGCSYSSAIAANLALGKTLEEAIKEAKKFIYLSVKNAPDIGAGKGPIAHKTGGEICHIKTN
jgi:hydroxymethylpyrimidine/phosphomethylpyrimidine kinase